MSAAIKDDSLDDNNNKICLSTHDLYIEQDNDPKREFKKNGHCIVTKHILKHQILMLLKVEVKNTKISHIN